MAGARLVALEVVPEDAEQLRVRVLDDRQLHAVVGVDELGEEAVAGVGVVSCHWDASAAKGKK